MQMGGTFQMGYDVEPDQTPLEQDDLLPVIKTVAAAADKRKGEDIMAIRVTSLTTITSFIVLVTGNSRPQLQAIAAAVEEDVLAQHDLRLRDGAEGTADSGWILLDLGKINGGGCSNSHLHHHHHHHHHHHYHYYYYYYYYYYYLYYYYYYHNHHHLPSRTHPHPTPYA